MRILAIILAVPIWSLVAVQQAVAMDVDAVTAPDTIVVELVNTPVAFCLAHVAIPDDAALQQQGTDLLKKAVLGENVRFIYDKSFGERFGTGRVQVLVHYKSVNVQLVEAGLARYEPGADTQNKYALQMAEAEAAAQAAKRGLWAKDQAVSLASHKSDTSAKPTRPAKSTKSTKSANSTMSLGSAKYVAELNGKYYYPIDSDEAAKLNQRKLVYYKSAGEAKKAGKKFAEKEESAPVAQTLESADALMDEGRVLYAKAVDMDVSDERDHLYGKTFKLLTQAMLIYRQFYEKDEQNAQLGETLRVCMEMRYGAMKYKRP